MPATWRASASGSTASPTTGMRPSRGPPRSPRLHWMGRPRGAERMELVGEPIRVACLSEHASPAALRGGEDAGGQNVYVDQISRHVARLGYAVDVFTRRDRPDRPDVMDW